MKKKGFAIVETLIIVVILTSALMTVYSTYNKSFIEERKRIYYDDVTYVYRTQMVRTYLKKYSSLNQDLVTLLNNNQNRVRINQNNFSYLFPSNRTGFYNLIDTLNIENIYIVKVVPGNMSNYKTYFVDNNMYKYIYRSISEYQNQYAIFIEFNPESNKINYASLKIN